MSQSIIITQVRCLNFLPNFMPENNKEFSSWVHKLKKKLFQKQLSFHG